MSIIKLQLETFFVTILILVTSIFLFALMDKKSCSEKFGAFNNKWGFYSGCLIEVNEKWISVESFYVKEDK